MINSKKINKNGFTPIRNKSLTGFTIIELMVAIFIFTIGILACYSIAQNPLHQTKDSMNKMIAGYLAQEGIEIVKNIRDNNFLTTGANWYYNLDSCASGCDADYSSNFLTFSGLLRGGSGDFYSHGVGLNTIFTRIITITEPDSSDCPRTDPKTCLRISVTVNFLGKSVNVQENIYNWYSTP